MGLFVYKTLIGDANDSPIVDDAGDDGQAVIGVMATYRF
jgi:outer membrane scaffolding protein for murein synthesis (MipA/OmpV family)